MLESNTSNHAFRKLAKSPSLFKSILIMKLTGCEISQNESSFLVTLSESGLILWQPQGFGTNSRIELKVSLSILCIAFGWYF